MTIHKHSLTNVNEQAFIHLSECNAEGTNTNFTECYKGPALFHLAALMLKAQIFTIAECKCQVTNNNSFTSTNDEGTNIYYIEESKRQGGNKGLSIIH